MAAKCSFAKDGLHMVSGKSPEYPIRNVERMNSYCFAKVLNAELL